MLTSFMTFKPKMNSDLVHLTLSTWSSQSLSINHGLVNALRILQQLYVYMHVINEVTD